MRLSLPTIGALAALQAFGVYAQEANECSKDINDCLAEAQGDFAGYGCTSSTDAACFCSGSLLTGVTTCAIARCPTASQDQISALLSGAGGLCADAQPATSAAVTTSPEAAATSEAVPASEVAEPTEALPTSSSVEAPAADQTSSAVVEEEPTTTVAVPMTTESTTEAAAETSAVPSAASDTIAESSPTESASATVESASGTSGAAVAGASATSSADAASPGLSKPVQIGIGVSVTVAVLALVLLGIGLCSFLKNRRRQQGYQGHVQKSAISQPLPDGGRGYDSRDSGSIGEKNTYDLELMSNRYEDMLPRQQPRTMV